jgi:two-component system, chemotaxis family, sensor kinase CheA
VSGPDAGLIELFRDETTRRLDQMDSILLAIESGNAGAEAVDSLFRHAHTIKGAAGMLGFDGICALAHATEDVLAQVRDANEFPPGLAAPLLRATSALRAEATGSGAPVGDIIDDLRASCAGLPGGEAGAHAAVAPAPGASGTLAPSRPAGPAEPAPGTGSHPADPPPPDTPPAAVRAAEDAPPAAAGHTLRVPAAKIDHLLDVAGEIMQYRRRLVHELGHQTRLPQEAADVFEAGERLLDDLKDTAVGMRTLPLAVITGPLPRAVRDLARTAGKDVEFVVTGEGTELDRLILESLAEPLTHLLRNSVVHGIESPSEREQAAKPPRGRLELRAVPRGSVVEIVVADDGRGISPEVIQAAHREGSLADFLTRPGYSTAGELTELAGRGVGLDAVKTYARSLGGSLEIRTEPGHGMDVVLLLPLALALTDVLLFERGSAVYGVPLAAIEEVVAVRETLSLQGQPGLALGGKWLPVTDLAAVIGAQAPPLAGRPPAIIVSAGGRMAAVTCDVLLGEEEVVVKPLGPLLAGVEGYLGASILGDGRIALLIEPAMLTRAARDAGPGRAEPGAADGQAVAPKVLVVEDSFTVRELQRSILEAAGYAVVTARDGRDALTALDRDAGISLVITDLEMPGLDGLELTRAIRADAARSSLPVVIVTSHGAEEDRLKGIEAGADAYMAKRNFDQQALLATVERLVGRVTA